jgi:DNA-binding transcriptional LysR family regulator
VTGRLDEMAVFVQVVEEGGFSAAAHALRLTPSAVSKQVARLEDRLGVRLMDRTTRHWRLTEEGEGFLERARRILADLEEAEQSAAGGRAAPRGILRVSVSNSFGRSQIVPLLPAFLARYPELRLSLTLSDGLLDLVEEHLDVAIRVAPLTDSTLIVRKLADNRRVICASPAYLARRGTPRTPDELAHHDCLAVAGSSGLNVWEFTGPGPPTRLAVSGRVEVNNTELLRSMALAGLGLIRIAEFLVTPDIAAGRLVPVLVDWNKPDAPPIHLVYAPGRHVSARVRAFVDYLVEAFTPTPPWERQATASRHPVLGS